MVYSHNMRSIVIIAHNIRSCHNVGSLLRTAEGLGIDKVYLTGYTPYPVNANDVRLPHVASKNHGQIAKTALGAENSTIWTYQPDVLDVADKLKRRGYELCALEQTKQSTPLPEYKPADKVAILLGSEVQGIDTNLLKVFNNHLEIPMFGDKESFNVVEAATMAMFHCRFAD